MHDCIWVLSICCSNLSEVAISMEDISCLQKKQTAPHPPPLHPAFPSGRERAPCCQSTRMCSVHSHFHSSYRSLELAINLKEPDASAKHLICLSLVVKLFSGYFSSLSSISAIKAQAQRWCF